jgi:hypothetical protein
MGQPGGSGGNGASGACNGGKGGGGGNGGAGGGGAGGLSAGVVWFGAIAMIPMIDGAFVATAGTLMNVTIGASGAGGSSPTASRGKDGIAQAVVSF